MKILKKLIVFLSFSFGTFCEDDSYDDESYEETKTVTTTVRKKGKNKESKGKSKRTKGRSGIIHTLTDKIHMCTDFDIINVPNAKEMVLNTDLKNINVSIINKKNVITWVCPTCFLGYNFSRSTGISIKIGCANTLQTQINRYKFKAGVVFRYNLNLLLSLRLLFEGGVGYCFSLKEDNRKFKVDNGNSSILKDLSSFFDTKLDPLIFCANFGIGFLFFSFHLGGEVSLSKLLSKHNGTSVNNKYQNLFNEYLNKKGINYFIDMLNISFRIYPLILVDYLIGWLI